ncbi:hypothetical protein FRB94_001280 [Tulasnella sp. JGI-2019a]|nr:hypothetical protein FRB94_001280 [Tulasnella sp. JGI-2019a]
MQTRAPPQRSSKRRPVTQQSRHPSSGAILRKSRDRGDLDQSIKWDKEAPNLRPEGHPDRGLSLSNLANSLETRFDQTGDRCDHDQSIGYNEAALNLLPEGHPHRGSSLNNLAIGLPKRFKETKDKNSHVNRRLSVGRAFQLQVGPFVLKRGQ